VSFVDEHARALAELHVGEEDDLVGVGVHGHRAVVGYRVLELLGDVLGVGVLDREDLGDHRPPVRKAHDVLVGTDHRGREPGNLAQHRDDDPVVRLDDADVVEAKRLEQQVQGLQAVDGPVVDQRDLLGLERRDVDRHHDLARRLHDERDRVVHGDVVEGENHLVADAGPAAVGVDQRLGLDRDRCGRRVLGLGLGLGLGHGWHDAGRWRRLRGRASLLGRGAGVQNAQAQEHDREGCQRSLVRAEHREFPSHLKSSSMT
jgi:hypothetical protein